LKTSGNYLKKRVENKLKEFTELENRVKERTVESTTLKNLWLN
jgi:hypothetical protein